MLKKILRFLLKFLFWVFIGLIILFIMMYAWSPVYNFPEPMAFSGSKIYNPYQGMDSTAWKKGNFQVQSKVWWGITDGRNNSNEAIYAVYKLLGYDVITISDYMKINHYGDESINYIPVYEHGYGFRKTHQVCIGAKSVDWLDYPFYQNLNHKQHIINLLKQHNDIVALAHPQLRDGYTLDDMRYLINYDLIEVLNQCRFSFEYWDAALSNGHAAYIIANDDAHDLLNPREVGMVCTFINTPSLSAVNVIDALKKGKAYGVDIVMEKGSDLIKKTEDHKKLPVVTAVEVKNDTLFVSVSAPFHDVIFIGQNGVQRKMDRDAKTAFYKITPGDTYIRTEITFYGATRYYLNPVFRYTGDAPAKNPVSTVNFVKTWIKRLIALAIFAFIGMLIYYRKKQKKNRRRISNHTHYYCL